MKKIIILLFVVLFISACTKQAQKEEKYFPKEQEAIQYGAKLEQIKILTQTRYKNETISLIFKSPNLIGVASVSSNKDGFSWYRSDPFFNIETKVAFDFTAKSGNTIPILIGKVQNAETKKVRLTNKSKNIDMELDVYQTYYIALGVPVSYDYEILEIQ
jgi:hypothetical protein